VGPVEADLEELDGPRIVPGPSSGVSKEVRCEFVGVPIVLVLEHALSM
jgi:hypothetical protein